MIKDDGKEYYTFDELPKEIQKAYYDNYSDEDIKVLAETELKSFEPNATIESLTFDYFDDTNPKEEDGYIIYVHYKAIVNGKEKDVIVSIPISLEGTKVGLAKIEDIEGKLKATYDFTNMSIEELKKAEAKYYAITMDSNNKKEVEVAANKVDMIREELKKHGEKGYQSDEVDASKYVEFEELPNGIKNAYWNGFYSNEFTKEIKALINDEFNTQTMDEKLTFIPGDIVAKDGVYIIGADFVANGVKQDYTIASKIHIDNEGKFVSFEIGLHNK